MPNFQNHVGCKPLRGDYAYEVELWKKAFIEELQQLQAKWESTKDFEIISEELQNCCSFKGKLCIPIDKILGKKGEGKEEETCSRRLLRTCLSKRKKGSTE